ncbi:efflux RND transporter periplasmic adaptor subunit [Candidatus Methylobacter favarea]|nr:efflux RND transporter periplasmic adaptor subunit [Candidatus Methylobacter favarea]
MPIIHRLPALILIIPTLFPAAAIKEKYPALVNYCLVRRKVRQGLVAALTVAVIYGCGNKPDSAKPELQNQAIAVTVAQPLSQEVTDWDEYTGRIEAVNSVDVRARVGGYLEKVNFKAGDRVKKGDLLFIIDPKPFQAQLSRAEAELKQAKAKQELAKNDLDRAEHLYRAKAISGEEYDARSKGVRESAGAVESAKANVYAARINLDFTYIRSPIDGMIGRELITAGNLVNGGGADPSLLTFIVSTDPVYVYVEADERSVLKYRRLAQEHGHDIADKAPPVQLALADESGFPHAGSLDYIAPREDVATGTLTLRGVFANPDGLLSPGFFARMRVQGRPAYPALLLPDHAIGSDQARRFVWVVSQENKVDYRNVVLGSLIGDMRVITEGVEPGEWVVIEGLQKLRPAMKVNPKRISLAETHAKKGA